ncbi:MAG: D-hexose-6-phosphate mutarotase [Candidatus Korobacteraceae bacterium]
MNTIEELDRRFAITGIAHVLPGNGGLPKVRITTPAASAEIYLHGAHVTSWKPAGAEEVLFLSEHSLWKDGRAIRGGIPICFPWFRAKADDPHAPAHGFVRTKAWQLEAIAGDGDAVTVSLSTGSGPDTRKWWPGEFHLVHRVSFGRQLKLELSVTNPGTTPLRVEEALHAYHRVGHVENTRLRGLDEVAYLDNTDSNREKKQCGDVVLAAATDNAYLNTQHALELVDPARRRRICITKENSLTTVVWNPWREGARLLPDLGDDEWQQMLCVEASNILGYALLLAPGQQHTMTMSMALEVYETAL